MLSARKGYESNEASPAKLLVRRWRGRQGSGLLCFSQRALHGDVRSRNQILTRKDPSWPCLGLWLRGLWLPKDTQGLGEHVANVSGLPLRVACTARPQVRRGKPPSQTGTQHTCA